MFTVAGSPHQGFKPVTFRARLHSLNERFEVLDALTSKMAARQFPENDVFGMRLALEEAIVNAVRHGHHDDPRQEVRIAVVVGADQVLADVEDEGPGFNPDLVDDPVAVENLERLGGRGLFLMRSLTTWMLYNSAANRVTLCRQRSRGRALAASNSQDV